MSSLELFNSELLEIKFDKIGVALKPMNLQVIKKLFMKRVTVKESLLFLDNDVKKLEN
jgi:hypothetical protein